MKVVCRHGHFAFYPSLKEDVIRFQRLFKLPLYNVDDYYTFLGLSNIPRWSQVARPFGNIPALVTYEGRKPWDVMKANDFVYSLATGLLVPRGTIIGQAKVRQTLDCSIYDRPLLQPGLMFQPGVFIIGYQAMIDLEFQKLYIYSQETLP